MNIISHFKHIKTPFKVGILTFILFLSVLNLTACAQTLPKSKLDHIIAHAKWQTTQDVTYDGRYRKISYPNGDVPADIGVCTDVVIRAYRDQDIDLQELVYHSVRDHLSYYYPILSKKGTAEVDPNIDHRRVRVLRKFFNLNYPESKLDASSAYKPGDIIIWDNWHIGILIDEKVPGTDRYYGVHNVGAGPEKSDFYYDQDQLDHYRWRPWEEGEVSQEVPQVKT